MCIAVSLGCPFESLYIDLPSLRKGNEGDFRRDDTYIK